MMKSFFLFRLLRHADRERRFGRGDFDAADVHRKHRTSPASISIRELRRSVRRILDRVQRGETIELTHRGQPVAVLGPCSVERGPSPWPNLEDRTDSRLSLCYPHLESVVQRRVRARDTATELIDA
jgi:prevent-host-death family protein